MSSQRAAEIVLFHSAQGLRPGVTGWADALRGAGHEVTTPDLFEGATFDRLSDGVAHRDEIGIPELIRRASESLDPLRAELVYAGFSMGASTAQYFAALRPGARAAVLMHGVSSLESLGVESWPAGVPVQAHHAVDDPWVDAAEVESFRRSAEEAGSPIEVHTYRGEGHLFADPDAPEYDAASAALMLERGLEFLGRL